jgi:1-acyl-sn-glycerol-3-phosphate acyltransferase
MPENEKLYFEKYSLFNYIASKADILVIELNISRALYYLGGKAVKVYSKIMLRMSVVSHFPMPKGAKIIVANHPTTSDPFILTSFSNGQAAVLIKNSLFNVPLFGYYLHRAGHIPVIKNDGGAAFKRALELLKKGITVIVFVEGDLSKFIHVMKKPKTGAVRLALASGASIIPVGISVKKRNLRSLRSVIKGIEEWGRWYFKGPYAITVGRAINLKGDGKDQGHVRKLSSWLSGKISGLAKESTSRVALR